MRKLLILTLLLLIPAAVWPGDKKKEEAQFSDVKVQVVKAENGKPVHNAIVVLHPVGKKGKQAKRGFELKTDQDGVAKVSIPYGLMRFQVIASGFQTYGEEHNIDQPTQEIVVKLNPPQEQHSIYK